MKRVFMIFTFLLALAAGTFYTWLYEPNAIVNIGLHLYIVLFVLSISSAFLSNLLLKIRPEENIILTTGGILLAVVLNSFFFNISLPHAMGDEIFIMLFFAGQASLLGSYGAVLAKKIHIKTPAKLQQPRKAYTQYSVFE